jgi:NAD(P)-dependent dehydrogenase (short-subunit alcohol dehydrogenase family)
MNDLAGRTAVITGGATGIGLAMAMRFAAEGMNVVVSSTNKRRLDEAVSRIRAAGGSSVAVMCDVSDHAQVASLARQSEQAFGPVHLLCANAGITTTGPFLDHRASDWQWVYDVVLNGVVNCVQVFYPQMAARGEGHLLLTGSQAGLVPDWLHGHGPYTSAKAAVMALGAALRPEAAEHGVGVSILIPAGTTTDMIQGARSRPARYGASADGPMKIRADWPVIRMISAEEVAAQALEGVRSNAPIIATHPELKPLVADYFNRILSAYDRPPTTGGRSPQYMDLGDDA